MWSPRLIACWHLVAQHRHSDLTRHSFWFLAISRTTRYEHRPCFSNPRVVGLLPGCPPFLLVGASCVLVAAVCCIVLRVCCFRGCSAILFPLSDRNEIFLATVVHNSMTLAALNFFLRLVPHRSSHSCVRQCQVPAEPFALDCCCCCCCLFAIFFFALDLFDYFLFRLFSCQFCARSRSLSCCALAFFVHA